MKKSTVVLNTEVEERFPFTIWSNLTKKEISRVYIWRRKSLLQGHCIRCAKELPQNMKCTVCDTDMVDFCFEKDLTNRDESIRMVKSKIKFKSYPF